MRTLKQVLVVHTWGIGDWVMFLPTFRAIIAAYPEYSVDVFLGTPSTVQIVKRESSVRRIYAADIRRYSLRTLGQALRARRVKYDLLIFSDGVSEWKAKVFARIVAARRAILPSDLDGVTTSAALFERHRVSRNMRTLKVLGVPVPADFTPVLSTSGETPVPQSVFVHPGSDAKNHFKRWPADRFVQLVEHLRQRNCRVTVAFGPSERDLVRYFECFRHHKSIELVEGLSFEKIVDRLANHAVCITSDSGLGHVAAALGVRVVTIFGPADPSVVAPYSAKSQVVRSPRTDLECMPCMRKGGQRGCAAQPCMTSISVERVMETLFDARPG